MNVLELFSGTKSVGKCCEKLGWNCVSVDLDPKFNPTHNIDIMSFDYEQYPKDYFNIVWGSPPCVEYSNLQSCWLGRKKKDGKIYTREIMEKNMNEADKLVLKTLEIIKYFNPYLWFLENPQTGKLKNREIMKDIPFYDVSYCMYSDWGYEKKTRIWTNKKDFKALVCDKSGSCGNMENGKHKARMGTSKSVMDGDKLIRVNTATLRKKYRNFKNVNNELNNETNVYDRYRVPEELIFSLILDN